MKKILLPFVFVVLIDIIIVVSIVVLKIKDTYEASLMVPYVIGLLMLIGVPMCCFGIYRSNKIKNQKYFFFFIGQIIFLVVLFFLAEVGLFR